MKLELKHLAPYLPYGVRFGLTSSKNQFVCTGLTIHEDGIMAHHKKGSSNVSLEKYYKPILRPLSDLNQPHFSVLRRITSRFEIGDHVWFSGAINLNDLNKVQSYLLEHHFDVFGLIPAGLAIDINTLKGADHV